MQYIDNQKYDMLRLGTLQEENSQLVCDVAFWKYRYLKLRDELEEK